MVNARYAPMFWTCVLWLSAGCGVPHQALGQEDTSHQHEHDEARRHHPPKDMALHERFYSTWHMPDNPALSCCNNADCYPTDVKFVDGRIYAKRREDGSTFLFHLRKWSGIGIILTAGTICARCRPMPIAPADTVDCFALGGAT